MQSTTDNYIGSVNSIFISAVRSRKRQLHDKGIYYSCKSCQETVCFYETWIFVTFHGI